MRAAVVSDFTRPPACSTFRDPEPREGFAVVRVLAAGVHQLVRSLAAGAHYGSGDELPLVPGVDAVALAPDGTRVYTGGPPDPFGTIAETTLVRDGFWVPVPAALDSATAAAVVNPAMSGWLPLAGTAALRPGQSVLVLGATGTSGSLAVRIARHLGAGRVVAAGRDRAALAALAALPGVEVVALGDAAADPAATAAALRAALPDGVDVVLDYLWGPVAQAALEALRRGGLDRHHASTTYVQVGAVAGRSIALDAALLRSSNLTVVGSGAGSVDPALLLAVLPQVLDLAAAGGLPVDVRARPLADVEAAWTEPTGRQRLVVTVD